MYNLGSVFLVYEMPDHIQWRKFLAEKPEKSLQNLDFFNLSSNISALSHLGA